LESDTIASLEALENVKNPRIHIFLAMSKEHIEGKFKKE
jgi:isopropylmalate/homocitrate/citramalate synthase